MNYLENMGVFFGQLCYILTKFLIFNVYLYM